MLTRCPACATHFRVTAEQLKVRSGRVRCGACQQVFNALDVLIEEPMAVLAPRAAKSGQRPSAPSYDSVGETTAASQGEMHEVTAPPAWRIAFGNFRADAGNAESGLHIGTRRSGTTGP
ncbi:MAG: zinc-ribbon domain-containing protein [Sulfuritalea sp.]|nr:zinc-ribbon domain-containing protein [Sulfuritalea sp.]